MNSEKKIYLFPSYFLLALFLSKYMRKHIYTQHTRTPVLLLCQLLSLLKKGIVVPFLVGSAFRPFVYYLSWLCFFVFQTSNSYPHMFKAY